MNEHKADASAHHSPYTDTEAVAAADASDKFVERNVENTLTNHITLKRIAGSLFFYFRSVTTDWIISTIPMKMYSESTNFTFSQIYIQSQFPRCIGKGTDTEKNIGIIYFKKSGGGNSSEIFFHVLNDSAGEVKAFSIQHDKNINHVDVFMNSVKSGATQGGAGAANHEVWTTSGHATLPDNVLMIGV